MRSKWVAAWSIAPPREIKDSRFCLETILAVDIDKERFRPSRRLPARIRGTAVAWFICCLTFRGVLLHYLPPAAPRTRGTQKVDPTVRSVGSMDLACRRKIYCRSCGEGVTQRRHLYPRRSTYQPPLCHVDQGPRAKQTGKNANCGEDIARPRRGKIALSAADIF